MQWHAIETGRDDEDVDEELECIAYFWEGRHASKMGRLKFEHEYDCTHARVCN